MIKTMKYMTNNYDKKAFLQEIDIMLAEEPSNFPKEQDVVYSILERLKDRVYLIPIPKQPETVVIGTIYGERIFVELTGGGEDENKVRLNMINEHFTKMNQALLDKIVGVDKSIVDK